MRYDALLVVSFGGPEGPDEVMPFLRGVVAGRGVPDERLAEVAAHYEHFDGVSPIVAETNRLVEALREALDVPVYLGNRNWTPWLPDAIHAMRDDNIQAAAAFCTSAFGSGPGCRRYREDVAAAVAGVVGAPTVEKLPPFGEDPHFLTAMTDRTREALAKLPDGHLVFTAHSIPTAMAATSPYVDQLHRSCAAVAAAAGRTTWDLVWQSRSGPPRVPWLEPDVGVHLERLAAAGTSKVVLAPIGFVADHMEVVWDLDVEAAAIADRLDIELVRAGTVSAHPEIVAMVAEQFASPDAPPACRPDCCAPPTRPGRP
jgi:protoporphyrin/coproporphyrin ferrochelatase